MGLLLLDQHQRFPDASSFNAEELILRIDFAQMLFHQVRIMPVPVNINQLVRFQQQYIAGYHPGIIDIKRVIVEFAVQVLPGPPDRFIQMLFRCLFRRHVHQLALPVCKGDHRAVTVHSHNPDHILDPVPVEPALVGNDDLVFLPFFQLVNQQGLPAVLRRVCREEFKEATVQQRHKARIVHVHAGGEDSF